ncbi:MAG: histidine phosphatase family protein [Deltaproteobacteria bacterium]|nr:histidine phosphatase family protein [Deltaproteobacteria bacterium]
MFEVLLVRHGQTDWNAGRRVMGRQPIGLNATGRAQVAALAGALAECNVVAIYASPTRRTMESAELLLDGHRGDAPLQEDPGLVEIDYGDWVNLPFEAVEPQPSFTEYLVRPSQMQIPGGERPTEVQARAVAAVERMRSAHPSGRVAVVSHADVIKVVLVHYLGMPLDRWQQFKIDNGSLTWLRFYPGGVRVVGVNWHPGADHLFAHDTLPHVHDGE